MGWRFFKTLAILGLVPHDAKHQDHGLIADDGKVVVSLESMPLRFVVDGLTVGVDRLNTDWLDLENVPNRTFHVGKLLRMVHTEMEVELICKSLSREFWLWSIEAQMKENIPLINATWGTLYLERCCTARAIDDILLAGRGDHGTGKEYENCVVEYVRSTEELYTCLMVISKLR